jgi:hypothetical protein
VYAAVTDLICVALVFVLAAFLFAMSVAIVMTAEGLKLLLRKWESAWLNDPLRLMAADWKGYERD